VSKSRIVVTGAAGQLGSFIVQTFADREVIALTRADLDITDPVDVRDVVGRLSPSVIINCAAFNDVDRAEDDAPSAFAGNAFALRSLARAAEVAGAALVHYSSDFVFDGTGRGRPYLESDPPSPRSVYAASKLVGEWFAGEAPRAYVLRVESLFGCGRGWQGRRGTLDTLVGRLEAGDEVRAFTDRVVSPSRLVDVSAATRHLLDVDAEPGLYHCVNTGHATWVEIVDHASRQLGLTARATRVVTSDVPMQASRPVYCALDNAKLAEAGFSMPPWSTAVDEWLAARRVE
jgi:dTDP-4-dehydrorhamnose reductase